MKLTEFISRENIKADAFLLGKKKDGSNWEHFEWKVDLVNMQGRAHLTPAEFPCPTHSLTYRMGLGHIGFKEWARNSSTGILELTGKWRMATQKEIKESSFGIYKKPQPIPPTVIDVLSNVHMTCVQINNSPLWFDWCADIGGNPDSIKEKELYERCVEEYQDFRKFFGKKFQEFLDCENDH